MSKIIIGDNGIQASDDHLITCITCGNPLVEIRKDIEYACQNIQCANPGYYSVEYGNLKVKCVSIRAGKGE